MRDGLVLKYWPVLVLTEEIKFPQLLLYAFN